jgi:hypothetical protein
MTSATSGSTWSNWRRYSPREGNAPRAVCTKGRRPSPPEDCGGIGGYELAVLANDPSDPEHRDALDRFHALYGPDVDPSAVSPIPSTSTRSTTSSAPGSPRVTQPDAARRPARGHRCRRHHHDRGAGQLRPAVRHDERRPAGQTNVPALLVYRLGRDEGLTIHADESAAGSRIWDTSQSVPRCVIMEMAGDKGSRGPLLGRPR